MSLIESRRPTRPRSTLPANANDDICWGAEQIGAAIRLTEKQAFHVMPDLVKAGIVRKFNGRYVASRARLFAFVAGE